jgi:integrase
MRFTKATVASLTLPSGKSDLIVFDSETAGFGVRLRQGGSKVWVAQLRIAGRTRRISIGDVGRIELDVARATAKRFFAESILGTDPIAARAEAKAKAAVTVGPTIERFLAAREGVVRPSTHRFTTRYLRQYFTELHALPVSSVTRREVAVAVSRIAQEHGKVAASRARVALSGFFSWALREGIGGESNPVSNTNDPAPHERRRDRVLSAPELKALWQALPATDFGKITKLLLYTACRRSEVGSLEWSEIDFDKRLLTIPGHKMKGGRTHRLPLVPEAVELLRSILRRVDNPFVFGRSPLRGFTAFSAAVNELRQYLSAAGYVTEAWSLHDLRRSVRSELSELGIEPWISERILAHGRQGVEGVYDWSRLEKPMRQALQLWADRLRAIIEDGESNVVPMRMPA